MQDYEVMYIVRPIANDEFDSVVAKFDALIKNNSGEILKTDVWGKKRLAYQIQDCLEGIYVLVSFKGTPETVSELDRVSRITDDILRHMIIKKC